MASKSISELDAILKSEIASADSFVLDHSNTAKRLPASTFISWAADELDGHGGIDTISKTSTSGLVDTYTITYADDTTSTFTVTNGEKGDAGDAGATGATGAAATIVSSSVMYQKSNSGSIIPSGEWQGNVPEITSGEFLWTRTTITFNTGSPVISYSVGSAGEDGEGTGTVTSVGVTGISGISVVGSTVTTSGSFVVGHSNHINNAPTTQAVYPITVDSEGHITAVGNAYNPCKTFNATLTTSWSSKTQILSSADFIANGYVYIVSPTGNPSAYADAQVYADDVSSDGSMSFHCVGDEPTSSIPLTITRMVSV